MRRLRWYQQQATNISRHICIRLAMFGRLAGDDVEPVDADGKISSSASPWALQFQEDMQALEAIDDGQSLLDRLHGCMVLVFTEYSGDFVAVDVSALWGTFAPNCIPPPGWVPPQRKKYSMMMLTMSRIVSFVIVLSRMEGHHKLWRCTKVRPKVEHATTCPTSAGFRLQTNVHGAKMFFRQSYPLETIFGEGWEGVIVVVLAVMSFFDVQQPESLECRVCEVCFDSVDDLLDHVSSHVVLPIPDAQHRAISDPSSCDIVSAGEMTSALTPWAQTRNPPSSECGVSKTVATSSDKFLMKGMQLFTKL